MRVGKEVKKTPENRTTQELIIIFIGFESNREGVALDEGMDCCDRANFYIGW